MRLIPYAKETTLDDYFKMPLSKSDIKKARQIISERQNWAIAFISSLVIACAAFLALPFISQMLFVLAFVLVFTLFTFLQCLACSVVVMVDGVNQINMSNKRDFFAVEKGEVFIPNSNPSVDRFLKNIESQDRPILHFEKALIEKAVWKS